MKAKIIAGLLTFLVVLTGGIFLMVNYPGVKEGFTFLGLSGLVVFVTWWVIT